ncbi:3-hydroxyisobutyrate dehydrogenase-like beta-hydroxyacid dehydrogenase [Lipingzhangella halophila]|uniref:3-hydroxyisobutyrate dehydrogenase-like beta-hydroxyacid dehydrogenase n=1 Tax=Lipingzhangella halophila TaxID=1783352 RepID=A0A7W7RFM2_9ACTN|nr:NAD(P)-binding domain-containing protein [Lipingzhangella halophila]MBB4931128.1 3-hydroxyisobutyrate dehydrogenase-like beta-hydroxyacid dehydrogenase [Lipingzhangella halophila]
MTTTPDASSAPITVLGLGDMGSAIARVFIDRGHPTTVWNRTASKSAPLVEAGASPAETAAEAVAASPLVVLCVLDYEAVDAVLSSVGDAISGRALVNVTSGSPSRARATQQWASEHGAEYLDGGVMGDPPDLGSGQVMLPYSGSRTAFDTHEATLRELGTPTYHGTDAGLASVEFMAQVAVGYELLIGFLHTLRLVHKEGGDVAEFAERVAGSVSDYPALLTAIGEAVRDGEYPPDLGPLSVQSALMGDLVDHRQSLGVDSVRMREVKELMDKRVADGHGDQGFSSLSALLDNQQ